MPKKTSPSTINQTAMGNDNIQVVGSNNVITRITNFFAGDTEQQRAQRNRRAMLELVKNTWIKGVLEKSLYNEVLIELDMEERPSVVADQPWNVQLRMPNRANRTLSPGTSIIQVFDEMNGAMLILGEPGSGKTTTLLELARDCIARSEQYNNQPIPAVFNLSSWDGKQTIENWLVKELIRKYYVPKKVAESWVENNDLSLFLDGLDEVKLENREVCAKAINDFRQKHGLSTPIVVCSRVADYEVLTTQLKLQGAVFLRALSSKQIEEYFEQAGSELEGIQQILRRDKLLQELVKQPLLLNVLILAYHDVSHHKLANTPFGTIETRRQQLFDTYIHQMFERVARTKIELYTPEQTKYWLAWLAQKMIKHNQAPYLLENMQTSWLDRKKQWVYSLIMWLINGLIFGLILGLIIGLIIGLSDWFYEALIIGLIVSLGSGLNSALSRIEMVDTITWDWRQGRKMLIFGLIGGLIIGMIYGPSSGLLIGLGFGLLGGVVGVEAKSVSQTAYPGQRISYSIKNFSFVFLVFGLIVTFSGGLILGPIVEWLDFRLINWLIIGPIFGLVSGLSLGGFAVIQHYTIRFIIALGNLLPWRLVPFLDYCVDRIFLRRVGGGYIFVHRLLMEHFADMYPTDEK